MFHGVLNTCQKVLRLIYRGRSMGSPPLMLIAFVCSLGFVEMENTYADRDVWVLFPMMRLTSSRCRGLAHPATKVAWVLMHTCSIRFFFFYVSEREKIWTPSMETRCVGVEVDPRCPKPNIYQRGLWGRGTLPLRGTFCHLCCVRSPQIHYSGPSETPSSLLWNGRAVQHLLQSSHPSGERQLETKQAE